MSAPVASRPVRHRTWRTGPFTALPSVPVAPGRSVCCRPTFLRFSAMNRFLHARVHRPVAARSHGLPLRFRRGRLPIPVFGLWSCCPTQSSTFSAPFPAATGQQHAMVADQGVCPCSTWPVLARRGILPGRGGNACREGRSRGIRIGGPAGTVSSRQRRRDALAPIAEPHDAGALDATALLAPVARASAIAVVCCRSISGPSCLFVG